MKLIGANDVRGKRNPRYRWLANIIKERGYTSGAEVGVDLGTTTEYLFKNCPNLFLYAVDLWQRQTQIKKVNGKWINHPDPEFALKTFTERTLPYHNRMVMLQGISWEVTRSVMDYTLDFVFIDADHKYESVKKDILAWTPKLKIGGMISGHDINMPGVLQAVSELIPNFKIVGIDKCWEAKREDVWL